jgi:hypothetical protein
MRFTDFLTNSTPLLALNAHRSTNRPGSDTQILPARLSAQSRVDRRSLTRLTAAGSDRACATGPSGYCKGERARDIGEWIMHRQEICAGDEQVSSSGEK